MAFSFKLVFKVHNKKRDNEQIKEIFLYAETGVQPAENVSSFDLH